MASEHPSTEESLRLFKAFFALTDPAARLSVIELMEAIAPKREPESVETTGSVVQFTRRFD